ncbi:MAG: hypothetical protein U0793_16855 [Gemmataceae bacterium]
MNDSHSVLAFYGCREVAPGAIGEILDLAIKWMAQVGCAPDLLGTNLNRGLIRFKAGEKKARDRSSDVDSFQLISLASGVRNRLEGTRCNICFQRRTAQKRSYLIVDYLSELASIGSTQLLEIAQEACATLKPSYGIGFHRSFDLGPVAYGLAVEEGDAGEEEGLRISHWGEALRYELFAYGLIRDVYPWNFLTLAQLSRKLGKQTFHEWICNDTARGSLSALTPDLHLWAVAERHIPSVRRALFEGEVIFDYDKHIQGALEAFNVKGDLPDKAAEKEFFQAWASKTREEMKRWFRAKYGCDRFSSPARSGEEILHDVLGSMGASPEDVRVLKVEKPGELRELSAEEVRRVKKSGRKK